MKKFILLLGALLFAAVFMSGCVTETEDPIVGLWHAETDYSTESGAAFESLIIVLNADGTGYSLAGFTDELIYEKIDVTWENLGDGKYSIPTLYTGPVALPQAIEFSLEGDVLTSVNGPAKGVFHREPVAEFLPGLWITDRGDYKEYQDIKSMIYFADDGSGNLIVYSSNVMGIDDVFTSVFTWEEKDGSISVTGEKGNTQVFTFDTGKLILDGEEAYHKYTVKDNLFGLWMSAEPVVEDGVAYDIVELIRSDGTGVEIWTVPGSHVASARYTFTWEMNSARSYKAVYDDGEVWEFEAVGLQLSDGEVVYSKVGFDVLKEYADKVNA